MNIYLLSNTKDIEYDMYDSVVVYAESETQARMIYPDRLEYDYLSTEWWKYDDYLFAWDHPDCLDVDYLGVAKDEIKEKGVILASYNAG